MKTELGLELQARLKEGHAPMTVKAISELLASLGYRLDRTLDCKSIARWMSGPRAGSKYPCMTTGVKEIDTGRSFAHIDSRRDSAFRKLQSLRLSGSVFAVVNGFILEI